MMEQNGLTLLTKRQILANSSRHTRDPEKVRVAPSLMQVVEASVEE